MSKERIAGRELDAEIAERVFGATWRKPTRYAGIDGVSSLILGDRYSAESVTYAHRWPDGARLGYIGPEFSTMIAYAFQVVEKMRDRGRHWRAVQSCIAGERYRVGFTVAGCTGGWLGRPEHEAASDSLPLAICLAALAAIEADAPEKAPLKPSLSAPLPDTPRE